MRLLDLFCGAGGAAMGYHRAGFTEIVGVDIEPQPHYPFDFVQGDALTPPVKHEHFDLIHASPPCQAYTTMNNRYGSDQVPMIKATRQVIREVSVPYVIENVEGAVRDLENPIRLTGAQFGLGVHRPRVFECCPFVMAPAPERRQAESVPVYGKMDGRLLWTRKDGSELRAPDNLGEPSRAMGIDWMTWDELRESIPPAYTEYLGCRFMEVL